MRRRKQEWAGFRIYAVRRVDGEGWSFVHALDSCTTLDEDLAERALLPGTRIEVTRGGTSEQHAPLEILPLDEAFHYACGRGWSYDYRAACWRAPDEAILPPAPGPHVERLEVAFQPPEWGWIDVRFTAGSVSFESQFTHVWDRLPELVEWLEQVWAGAAARFWWDIEGSEIELHLWPHEAALHLLIAHNTVIGRYEEIDVVLPRAALVRSIYLPLISYWESPALVDNWCHWASYTEAEGVEVDERGHELYPYALRSPTLDRVLDGSA